MAIELSALQCLIVAASHSYTKRYGIERSTDWTALKFAEEAGEVVQAYLKFSGRSRHAVERADAQRNLASEIADVIGMALILAFEHNLDLVSALEQKWHISLTSERDHAR
jgi:NTP pyrophosphatase (non-canonical NTP hydrolase)